MRALFVDIDGVFNSTMCFTSKIKIINNKFNILIDLKLVNSIRTLLELCIKYDIKIIMTTCHAKGKSLIAWHRLIKTYLNLNTSNIIIYANAQPSGDRGLFIKNTITKFDISDYLVLDDDIYDIAPYIKSNYMIRTNRKTGLNKQQIIYICEWILKNKKEGVIDGKIYSVKC